MGEGNHERQPVGWRRPERDALGLSANDAEHDNAVPGVEKFPGFHGQLIEVPRERFVVFAAP